MKKRKLLFYLLIVQQAVAPNLYAASVEKTQDERQQLLTDIAYTGLGVACFAGALLAAKLYLDVSDTRKFLNQPDTAAGSAIAVEILLKNPAVNSHVLRWLDWYPTDSMMKKAPLAEVIGCYLLTGALGVLGVHFFGKGLYFKKWGKANPVENQEQIKNTALLPKS